MTGPRNMRGDIEAMLGTKYTKGFTYYIWVAAWMFTCPTICFVT